MAAFCSVVRRACFRIHRRGAGQKIVDVETLQRRRHQAHRAHDRSAAADPIVHGKARQPAVLLRVLVQLAADAGDGDRMFSEIQTRLLITRRCFQHPVARFFRAAGFRNHHRQRVRKMIADLVEGAVEPVGVRVIEKINIERIGGVAERVGDELRSERRTADADQEDMLEASLLLRRDLSRYGHRPRIALIRALVSSMSARSSAIGREFGIAQPVVADHALFVRVRDRAGLELAHGGERLFDAFGRIFSKKSSGKRIRLMSIEKSRSS